MNLCASVKGNILAMRSPVSGSSMKVRCADAVFFNGKIVTLGPKTKTVSALAVEDGLIVSIGDDREVKGQAPRGCGRYDLGGRVVAPGFVDSHTHFVQMGVDAMNVDLTRTRSKEEALALMGVAAKKVPPGEWVIGTGWKESGWTNPHFVTGKDLDISCPDNPAVAHRVCGHMSTVNSQAVSLLGIDSRTPDVETDSSGRPTGILRESAVSIARAATAPDEAKRRKGLQNAIRKAHSLGVTSIHDNGQSADIALYREAERAHKLGVRVWFNIPSEDIDSVLALHLTPGLGSEMLKLGGLKVFCDGALGARTAAVSDPYADDPGNKGALVHDQSDFEAIVERANAAGIQLAIHAIGDVGIDVTIAALKSALDKSPRNNHRHRIEHLELPSRAHLKTMRRLGLIASMQPNFIGEWGGTDGMYLARLGKARTSRNNPFREVLDERVKLVFGSDCMPFSPAYGILSAVRAPHPAQRISVKDAFSSYTRDAAYASFEEDLKGTLEMGKLADFVVLSADPFGKATDLGSVSVVETVLGGEVVFDRSKRREA